MKTYQHILVVSRSTRQCRRAVETGISLARLYQAHLTVLHVIHDPFSLEGWNLPVPSLEAEYRKMVEDTRKEIDKMVAKEKERGLTVYLKIREGIPQEEILRAAEEDGADLILISSHEQGRLEHLMFGRTNEALIRRLPADLLLVREEA